MATLQESIPNLRFLAGVPQWIATEFVTLGDVQRRACGHRFWSVGSPAREVVVPITGAAKSLVWNEAGRGFIDAFVGPGQCAGLLGTLDEKPHDSAVDATGDGQFLVVRSELVRAYILRRPQAMSAVLAYLSRRLRSAVRERRDMTLMKTRPRIARLVLDQSGLGGTNAARIPSGCTQTELAERLGTCREVISRTLREFASRGLVTKTPSGFVVTDWAGLRDEGLLVLEPPLRGGAIDAARVVRV